MFFKKAIIRFSSIEGWKIIIAACEHADTKENSHTEEQSRYKICNSIINDYPN